MSSKATSSSPPRPHHYAHPFYIEFDIHHRKPRRRLLLLYITLRRHPVICVSKYILTMMNTKTPRIMIIISYVSIVKLRKGGRD